MIQNIKYLKYYPGGKIRMGILHRDTTIIRSGAKMQLPKGAVIIFRRNGTISFIDIPKRRCRKKADFYFYSGMMITLDEKEKVSTVENLV